MTIIRRIVSFLVLVAGTVMLVGICMSSMMSSVWSMFGAAFSPFDFQKLVDALAAFMAVAGTSIVLIMLGFIGFSIPKVKKIKN